MNPDTPQSPAPPTTPPSGASDSTPQADQSAAHREAAANIIRGQIDSTLQEPLTGQTQETSPYHRTHQETPKPTPEQWQHYHSAWQDYYQKYYERYYIGHLHQARQAIASQSIAPPQTVIGSRDTTEQGSLDNDEALYELRHQLLDTVQKKAAKVRKSRHFVPIAAAVSVMLLFSFLQYNQLLIANVQAYVSPGNIDPENIIVDPTTAVAVDPASTSIVIPKINIDAPVDYNAAPDYDSQMAAMKNGLAYFGIAGANSKPGQVGNTPVAGHSSNDVFETGNYKFIFAQLDKVQVGDAVYANYQGTRYTYVVTKKEVVLPTEVNKLVYTTDKPLLTLITCTPLGTAQKRLLVTAEQVNPSPTTAAQTPTGTNTSSTTKATEMAGTAPSIFERLFGAH
ncbi:MAG: sortase family protein [Candidatus Saccharibacteria bacterium]|nr:sortase family protein [Candidatus Saccharibacteria bacterium]